MSLNHRSPSESQKAAAQSTSTEQKRLQTLTPTSAFTTCGTQLEQEVMDEESSSQHAISMMDSATNSMAGQSLKPDKRNSLTKPTR